MTVIALWAHPRAVSTAFVRMMMERGDVTVVHEPMVLLTDHGETRLPAPPGGAGPTTVRAPGELYRRLAELGAHGPVFFKDTLEYRYAHLFDHPEDVAAFRHTFIVRDPARTIASHHAVKPSLACAEIGYEHQWRLFTHLWKTTGERPLVFTAESLLADPPAVVRAYCAHVGLPFRPEAMHWQPGERPEWEQNRRWHLDAIASSGFRAPVKEFAASVHDDPRLRAFHAHHLPYYERLVEHALTTT
ncbi:sulfotransferase family protein [Streptomyces sp. DSM 42041]|uniref:Sulfotransferase family protein n=1 Tax=Streptomyces hazeniae TaxID=3075538 RepID=A0ABU2NQX1_9ACTN|nr:sulfotransferase family protein [Streptomyces sp. DSM 42041]MDT0379377.1 sulfotransferase family protein [Streptomyces sp. DSM 42041]